MKPNRFNSWLFFALLSIVLSTTPAVATTISLDFSTLPSDQGFEYLSSSSTSEANVFSTTGAIFQQRIVGKPLTTAAVYRDLDALEIGQDTELLISAQVLDYESATGSIGFGFNVIINTKYHVNLGFTDSGVLLSGRSYSFDTMDIFHDYRITLSSDSIVNFYIDGAFRDSYSAIDSAIGRQGELTFGDRTAFENLDIDISKFLITQSQNIVPEPTTMLLFGIGLLGLAGVGRRKKPNNEDINHQQR